VHYGRHIRWTDGDARLEVPPILGIAPAGLELELAAFMGRHGDTLRLVVDPATTLRHRMGEDWDVVWLPLAERHDGFALHLQSASHFAPGDPRRLGVRLDRVGRARTRRATATGRRACGQRVCTLCSPSASGQKLLPNASVTFVPSSL
jgi:hypothetical protein